MLDLLIRFSIKQKLLVGLFTLGLVAWGGYALVHLPIDAVPDITNNQVQIITQSPALGGADVERLITFPIEQAIATVPGIEQVRSFSRFGLSVITVVFPDGTDVYWARQQITERLGQVRDEIPRTAGQPGLAPVTTGLGEIYQYALEVAPAHRGKYSPTELRTLQDWLVRRQLLGTPGVADVSSFGGFEKQYEVALNPERLRSYGLSVGEVFTALEQNNGNAGGAFIDKGPVAYFIRTEGLAATAEQIGQVVVRPPGPGLPVPVLVRDVATVRLGHAVRYGLLTQNDEGETVGGLVLMLKGANSSEVIAGVKARVAQIQKTLPPGIAIRPFLDRTKLVNTAINTVQKNLIEGALIVVFVLVLFLGSLRAGLLVASVIPLAMLFAVGMMRVFGVSGNLLSLGAIDFGLIVDGTVIIVEAVMHRLALAPRVGKLTQGQMDEEVYQASSQIRSFAAFGEIIILIVYLPLLALGGIEGKMFRPMAQTVAFAIGGAFILSLTYVPMMSTLVLSRATHHAPTLSDRVLGRLGRWYRGVVSQALRRPALVLALAAGLMAGALALFTQMGGEFLPTLEEGDFAVETRVLPGSSLGYTAEQAQKAAGILKRQFPEVIEVVGKIGSSAIPTDPMPPEACDLIVVLKERDQWTSASSREELASKMAEALAVLPGVTFGFQQPIQMRFNELISGARQDVVVKIFGEDLTQLDAYARQVGRLARQVPGAQDVYVERATGQTQIVARIRRDKLAELGLSVDDINRTVQAAFAGAAAGQVYEQERRFDLVVRLEGDFRQDIANVRQLFVPTPDGRQVPLEQVADVAYVTGPSQIQRDDAKRRITVGFNVRGRDVESIVADLQRRIEQQLRFAPGYYATYGGQFENLRSATARLQIAVPVALLLIFLLLYSTFGSVRQAVLIFTAIPLSAIGGVAALWLRGMPFSISAGVGFIALFGVAVLNGIVLIGYFNQLKAQGWADVRARILEGTQVRLRPVLMTATVASLGFLPMALAHGSGGEVQKPLATVVIGGLISATLLTLLVLPVLYELTELGWRAFRHKRAAALVLLGLVGWGLPAGAQTPAAGLTQAQAIAQALGSNGTVLAAQQQLAAGQAGVMGARHLGATSLQMGYGQFNSINGDNQFTLAHTLPWPGYYGALAQAARTQVLSRQTQLALARAEVRRQVGLQYQSALHARHRLRLLRRQDSTYAWFLKAAEARRRAGEAARIESATATVQLGEVQATAAHVQGQYGAALRQLQALLQAEAPPTLADTVLAPLAPQAAAPAADSARLARTLLARLAQNQVLAAQAEVRVAQVLQRPSVTLGYFNQSLAGTQEVTGVRRDFDRGFRFQAVQAGLAFPVWLRPVRARIQAARLQADAARTTYRRTQAELAGRLEALLLERQAQQTRLRFYTETALPQAELIARLASKAFRAGEAGYTEYLLQLERAFRLQTEYIDLLLAHNQTTLEIDYLLTEDE